MSSLLSDILHFLRDPSDLIRWGGYPIVTTIIFLETGAMFFFLPGDSLLVVAGLYAAKGDLNIALLNLLLIPAAILGDACSYYLGKRMGEKMIRDHTRGWIKAQHIEAAKHFYQNHGGKAIVLARFVPLVRTFVPIVAGTAGMAYRTFATYNVLGGILWVSSMTLIGYILGGMIPDLHQHVEKVSILIVLLSISPAIWKLLKKPTIVLPSNKDPKIPSNEPFA